MKVPVVRMAPGAIAGALMLMAAAITTAPEATAQPFGIAMGTPMSELDIGGESPDFPGTHAYRLSSVPKPHSAFKEYTVTVAPISGVCQISAKGERFDDDPSGENVRAAYGEVLDQLVAKYGDPRSFGLLDTRPGALNDDRWVRAVHLGDNVVIAAWGIAPNATLENDLATIFLNINALDPDSTQLDISYNYSNTSDCGEEDRRANAVDIDAL